MQPTRGRSAPPARQSLTTRRHHIDRADAVRQLAATLAEHGPQMWHVAAALAGEPQARDVVAAAAGLHLHSPGQAIDRADLLTTVCDVARPIPAAGGVFSFLPDRAREAYVLTQIGELTYAQTARALRTTSDEIRAACKTARDHLAARSAAPPPRRLIDRSTCSDELPSEVDHA